MIAKGGGRIVFMGSMAGLIPMPFYAPYAMTKSALESVAFSLRTELKPFGIKVIVINPGGYNTGFNEKNLAKKYEWMDVNGLYKDHMAYVREAGERLVKRELQDTQSIAKQVVKAVEARGLSAGTSLQNGNGFFFHSFAGLVKSKSKPFHCLSAKSSQDGGVNYRSRDRRR